MSTTRIAIEKFMNAAELKYFYRADEGGGSNWVLLFNNGGVHIRLTPDGESLLLRSMALAKLDSFSEPQRANLLRQLLKRNNLLIVGHYSADDDIIFETSLPIDDGALTAKQFHHCLAVVTTELEYFADSVTAMTKGELPIVGLGQLLRHLIHGGSEPATQTPPDDDEAGEGFQVVLTNIGKSKLDVVKIVKQQRRLPLLDCKKLVEAAPTPIGCFKTRSEAESIVRELTSVGASAVII